MEKAGEDGFGDGSGTAARVIGSCDFPAISPIAGSTRDTVGQRRSWFMECCSDGQGVTKTQLEE